MLTRKKRNEGKKCKSYVFGALGISYEDLTKLYDSFLESEVDGSGSISFEDLNVTFNFHHVM